MNFGGYDAFDDPYAYKGTHVLKNRLGLRDAAVLESFELEMSTLRAKEPLPDGRYDPTHYRRSITICFRTSIAGPENIERCALRKAAIHSASRIIYRIRWIICSKCSELCV